MMYIRQRQSNSSSISSIRVLLSSTTMMIMIMIILLQLIGLITIPFYQSFSVIPQQYGSTSFRLSSHVHSSSSAVSSVSFQKRQKLLYNNNNNNYYYPPTTKRTQLYMASTLENNTTTTTATGTTTKTTTNQQQQSSKRPTTTTKSSSSTSSTSSSSSRSFVDRVATSSIVSAAAVAASAVNAAVSMKTLEAPDASKSYVTIGGGGNTTDTTVVGIDKEGLPLRYDKKLIEAYWNKERGALQKRWTQFLGKAVPFLTRLVAYFVTDGTIPESEIPSLAKQARLDIQELGPTFIKLGQMMSVRPDVLPASALDELQKLQDSVKPFATTIAIEQIEKELGGPLGEFFATISEEPVAAASLAQVYKATLRDGITQVAIKVQRPDVLGTVSQDLYVLRRAAEVFDGLVRRFAPQQKTDYVALLNEWAIGFYTELDFNNEANNQQQLRNLLINNNITNVIVPKVYKELCTRRILVSEWIDGKKLSDCTPDVIAQMTPIAQEAFLTQLFEVGFFHADPHPGNVLVLNNPTPDGAQLCLIDCGLMATIDPNDRDYMISAVIHLANKNYGALVDDFINLGILPKDSNRATIVPLMDKALTPYVMGGGAKRYEEEVRKLYGMEEGSSMTNQVGGFQAMTQDALTVLQDVPFSIPAYFAILGRAIVTLEGVALQGNPNYGIIMESYPFIARKLLREGRPEIQKALQEVLYSSGNTGETANIKFTRLLALLNNAAGSVVTQNGAAFVDLDGVPTGGGLSLQDGIQYVLSDRASSLRSLLLNEFDTGIDVLTRQIFRRAISEVVQTLTPPKLPSLPFLGNIFPEPRPLDEVPFPIVLPPQSLSSSSGEITMTTESLLNNRPTVSILSLKEFTNLVAPPLSPTEELYALSLADASTEFLSGGNGQNSISQLLKGDRVISPQTMNLILSTIRSGILGRSDLLSSSTVQSILDFVSTVLRNSNSNSLLRPASTTSSAVTITAESDNEYMSLFDNLNDAERQRLDEILRTLTTKALERTVQRLSNVERIL